MGSLPVHTLVFLQPGHFHAALTLRQADHRLNDEVHVYAKEGPELDAFLALVAGFNAREHHPTRWRPVVYAGPRPRERLLAERPGDVLVLAGPTDRKLADILAAHQAGMAVLADKPWVLGAEQEPLLRAALGGPPLALDIMTERHEIVWRLARALVRAPEVFGEFAGTDDLPAIELFSTHQLYKQVSGQTLRRPAWYFDVARQGDGIVDVPSHLVDLVQWLLGGPPCDVDTDVGRLRARRWCTPVPADAFERITGVPAWPPALWRYVGGGALQLAANGELRHSLRGLPVRVHSVWALSEEPASDHNRGVLRGTRAEVEVTQGVGDPEARSVTVRPVADAAAVGRALETAVAGWSQAFPGLAVHSVPGGYALTVPAALVTPHETNFARVLDRFLAHLDVGDWPADEVANLRAKYTLLGRAQARAVDERP